MGNWKTDRTVTLDTVFTGKERDAETGLDYFGARYFSGAQGRWTSPDLINVTKARLLNPTNTLNKYVYGANNPLNYVDPDGKDITIFYRRGNMANPADSGHAFAAVLNQNTGQTAFMSFAPKRGAVPFGAGAYNAHLSPDYLRQHASLTIQTTPELAQKAIDEINRRLQNPGSYNLFTNNCTTQCESLLRLLDIATTDGFHPDDLWTHLYRNYSAQAVDHGQFGVPSVQYQPGKEFGQPRFAGPGFDYQQFLWQLYINQIQTQPREPKGCVTVQGPNGTETECH
jgi:RHS repeat-associated protein